MQKAMVFIDYENFSIALRQYYQRLSGGKKTIPAPNIDYRKLSKEIINLLPNQNALTKTFLFVPKPDDFLMQSEYRKKEYEALSELKNLNYLTIIEGSHISRQVGNQEKNINDKNTYFVEEKGTDVNMAVHLLTKGFLNAYDTAIIISADTDYKPIMDMLNTFGKTVCVAGVQGQALQSFKSQTDQQLILDDTFFQKCQDSRPVLKTQRPPASEPAKPATKSPRKTTTRTATKPTPKKPAKTPTKKPTTRKQPTKRSK